jgi:predicted NBD/HSP70 family sugar kinase
MQLNGFPLPAPKIPPVLDPTFRPAVFAMRHFRATAQAATQPQKVRIALERDPDSISRFDLEILPQDHPHHASNGFFLERLTKFLLWSRGGHRIWYSGPVALGNELGKHYQNTPTGQFDADIMGNQIYEQPFEVRCVDPSELPEERESTKPLGRHLKGCRIGFDLGASDRKVAAVIDGETVFSEEIPWHPKPQTDPDWHFKEINDSLKRAADRMPKVDAIGGSSAGVFVRNRVKVASLFRGVPSALFDKKVKDLFLNIQKTWQNIPLEVSNDGDITALAGSMTLNQNAVLGVAMGSSEAAGYVNRAGNITSWLNELAFCPIDFQTNGAVDEWSGDRGCGVQCFSQQAVGRLIPKAGLPIDPKLGLPEQLVKVQELMQQGDDRAALIYRTIGVWFGYAIAHYADFYDFDYLLIMGRVTSGPGGEMIMEESRRVLNKEFPEQSEKVKFHIPDEKEKRHGQAMAAASLPVLDDMS